MTSIKECVRCERSVIPMDSTLIVIGPVCNRCVTEMVLKELYADHLEMNREAAHNEQ